MTRIKETALEMYNRGKKWSCSTSIDEDTILMGYGSLGSTDFEFPLPSFIVIKEFGTESWIEYLKNKAEAK